MTNKLEVIENLEDAEDADCVVCARLTHPLMLPDNIIDLCSMCGEAIQHRPHIPKRPALVCFQCIMPRLREERAKGELLVTVTPKTAKELDNYLRKKNAN
jgi:hypothetical protein